MVGRKTMSLRLPPPGKMHTLKKEEKLATSPYISERYMASLAGASGMWAEMQSLLDHGVAHLSADGIRCLIIEKNILNKRTVANRKEAWKKLKKRYSISEDNPAFTRFLSAYYAETSAYQRGLLVYLLLCTSYLTIRRLSRDWLAPRLAKSGIAMRTEDVEKYLIDLEKQVPELVEWTSMTRHHVCQHYLGAIRDFGLAEGRVVKRTTRPHVGSRVLVYAIQLAQLQGLKPLEVLQSDWICVLGLDLDTTITRMYQLNAEGLTKFRMSGNVAELSLRAELTEPE